MHIDIAVVTECGRDRQACVEGTVEAVDLLAIVLGKFAVNSRAVEAVASNIVFE